MISLPIRFALLLPIASMLCSAAPVRAASNSPAEKGAKIYCYMRRSGNDHVVSWEASYSLIKRQSGGLFKTSPQHAAVMITEAVVENPDNFPDCGQYLGDLFGGSRDIPESSTSSTRTSESETPSNWDADERYSY